MRPGSQGRYISSMMPLPGQPQPPRGGSDYARVERAIHFIQSRVGEQPTLAEVAAQVGLSEFHFQRLFQRWAGISPKRFLQFLTLQEAKGLLAQSRSVLDVSLQLGLSSPSRLHDLFLSLEQMTPGEYRGAARGLTIAWAVEATPLGPALFAAVERGLCGFSFVVDGDEAGALQELESRWPGATLRHLPGALHPYAQALRERLHGDVARPLGLVLKGTALQLRVWEALLRIPPGHVATYSDVARLAGAPSAVRAVATAVGRNPIACLIPCHRVIQSTGALGSYHWGSARKQLLLGLERARAEASP